MLSQENRQLWNEIQTLEQVNHELNRKLVKTQAALKREKRLWAKVYKDKKHLTKLLDEMSLSISKSELEESYTSQTIWS